MVQEDPLEKAMATHTSILAWRIPETEEPGRVQSMRSQKVRPDWRNISILSPYMFLNIIFSSCIDPFNVLLSFTIDFVVMSSLSDMGIECPKFFFSTWFEYLLLYFSLCVSLDLKWISCRQRRLFFCLFVLVFLIHLATLCLPIGAFSLLTLKYVSTYYLLLFVF